jgi:hypothetical protein
MTLPERPSPLTNEERIEKIEAALDSDAGQAVRGVFLAGLALNETGVDPEVIMQGRLEAPDSGIGMSQAVLDDLPPEQRELLIAATTEVLRRLAAEAIFQLEASALNIHADPRTIEPDMVAIVASLPMMLSGQRFLDQDDEEKSG